jgi:putative ABC transport system permease protein
MSEAMTQALIGGLVGAIGAYVVLGALGAAGKTGYTAFLGPLGGFRMSTGILGEGILVALLVGVVSGAVPAWNGARLPVVEALRRLF